MAHRKERKRIYGNLLVPVGSLSPFDNAGGDGLQTGKVVVNMLSKQAWAAVEVWFWCGTSNNPLQ
jgi:hypothetical protein